MPSVIKKKWRPKEAKEDSVIFHCLGFGDNNGISTICSIYNLYMKIELRLLFYYYFIPLLWHFNITLNFMKNIIQ
jgi:hypothetical protein